MPTQPGAFRIKWGKLSIALIGMLALVAVPVTLVLAIVTSLSLLAPLVCAVLVVLCLASLRAGAVVSRRRSAWERAASVVPADASEEHTAEHGAEQAGQAEHATQAEQTAKELAASQQAPQGQPSAEKAGKAAEREEAPFDIVADGRERTRRERAAARAAVAGEAAASRTATADRTDAEQARNEQAGTTPRTAPAAKGEKAAQGEATTSGTANAITPAARKGEKWAPRELPTPTYLAAEPAERALPAPLEQDEEKTATEVTSIRQAEAQRLAAERTQRLDLDAVLQRRRA